jgi:hypothetical protein
MKTQIRTAEELPLFAEVESDLGFYPHRRRVGALGDHERLNA